MNSPKKIVRRIYGYDNESLLVVNTANLVYLSLSSKFYDILSLYDLLLLILVELCQLAKPDKSAMACAKNYD